MSSDPNQKFSGLSGLGNHKFGDNPKKRHKTNLSFEGPCFTGHFSLCLRQMKFGVSLRVCLPLKQQPGTKCSGVTGAVSCKIGSEGRTTQ